MVISLKHKKNVSIADDPAAAAAGQVVSSNWNDEHDLLMAASRILGRVTAGTGVAEELTAAQVRTFINVTDAADPTGTTINAATAKTTPVDADTMPLIDSAASNALKKVTWANIKATLKTYFDTLYQGTSSKLTALAGQTWAADQITYQTGASTVGTTALTAFARTLLDDTNQATAQATLGVVPGTNVQAFSSLLSSIAALTLSGNAGKSIAVNTGATGFELVAAGGGSVIKSIQSGYISATSLTAGTGEDLRYTDVTIAAVDQSKVISVTFDGGLGGGASSASAKSGTTEAASVSVRLTSSTNLRISAMSTLGYSTPAIVGRWRIVEAL